MSTTRDDDNPFAPPKAAVLEAESTDGELVADGQKVATGRGVAWYGEGWDLFKASPGIWVAIFLIFLALWLVMSLIPLGGIAVNLFYPVMIAGVMAGCRTLQEGGRLEVAHLFLGFKQNTGNLILVGVLYLVGWIVVSIIGVGLVMAFMIPIFAKAGAGNVPDFSDIMTMAPWIALMVLVGIALALPLIMALWFAPALVIFHDMQPTAAMRASFVGCLKNIVPFLVYGVVGLLLLVVAMIPFGLGLLVYGPLVWGTMYVGYRDIFVRQA